MNANATRNTGRRMSDKEQISPSQIVSWIIMAFGAMILLALCWVGNNAAQIPVMQSQQAQQNLDLNSIKVQISDVPIIKVQMENITKQLEHINSTEDSSGRAIEEGRNKLQDHERRIQTLESVRRR